MKIYMTSILFRSTFKQKMKKKIVCNLAFDRTSVDIL